MSLARFNLSKESEDGINRQILVELSASYTYLSMAAWLSRDSVALQGLAEYYRKMSASVCLFVLFLLGTVKLLTPRFLICSLVGA